MQVILKENVENLGHIGDIVKVAPGYARNFLLPKKLALPATEKNAKELEHAKRQLAYKKNQVLESAKLLAGKLEALSLTLSHKAGEEGKLFGSVTNMDIAAALKANGIEIDRKAILLQDHIKSVGEYSVPVKIHPELSVAVKLAVTAA